MEKPFRQEECASHQEANESHPLPHIALSSAPGIHRQQVKMLSLPIDGIVIPAELPGNLDSLFFQLWFAKPHTKAVL